MVSKLPDRRESTTLCGLCPLRKQAIAGAGGKQLVSELKTILERLYSLAPRGRKLGLDRVRRACDKLGNPEQSFAAIHVGGTNGKGSVTAFLASMLRASKRGGEGPIGMFTSPHLCQFGERIQIDGMPLSDADVVRYVGEALDASDELTFFETTTLAAFLAFRDKKVSRAVVEVGLGGRLDATNVLPPPEFALITRVAFDHQDVLGPSLRQIATEKAAIIKEGSKVVVGKLHPHAREAVEERAAAVGAEVLPLGGAEPFPGAQLAYPRMAMFGTNLAVATTVARAIGLEPDKIALGIERTVWPGRNELLHRNGEELTLLDACHNPDGAVLLSHIIDATASETVGNRRNVALVFGAMQGKNWRAMLARLEHTASHRVFVAANSPKSVAPEEFAAALPGEVASSIGEGLRRARTIVGPRGLVVVAGSIFVVGPARAALLGIKMDPPIDM